MTALHVWIDQDVVRPNPLLRLTTEYRRAKERYEAAWEKWLTASTRIDHRLSRCELLHLYFDMEEARVQRASAFSEWSRAFDALRGEGL